MQQACNDCHGARYQGTLDTWRELIASRLAQAQAEYAAARAAVDAAPLNPTERLKADRLLDDAAHNIRFVRLGHGVHNINYATAALNIAIEWSQQARRLAENRQTAGAGP
jgi:hypothetical protein